MGERVTISLDFRMVTEFARALSGVLLDFAAQVEEAEGSASPAPVAAPAPPAPAPAPAAAPAPPAQPELGDAVEVDSAGQPWDPAVHSEGRSKTKDGRWRVKRGAKESPASAAPAPAAPVASPAAPDASQPEIPDIPATPAAPPPPPPAPAAAPALPVGAIAIGEVVKLLTSGRVSREQVGAALASCGVPALGDLKGASPETVEKFRSELAGVMV